MLAQQIVTIIVVHGKEASPMRLARTDLDLVRFLLYTLVNLS